MRGRIIQRFIAVFYRVDPVATSEVVGGGWDAEFGEALPVADGTRTGKSSRREQLALRLMCQIDRQEWGGDDVTRGGLDPRASIALTVHRQEFERRGLIDANGIPLLYPGDRLDAIEDLAGHIQERFPDPPGMFIAEGGIERVGLGLAAFGRPRFNLFTIYCSRQKQGSGGAS